MNNKKHILELNNEEWEMFLKEHSQQQFRKKQIINGIYQGKDSFLDMTDLPLSFRETLNNRFVARGNKIIEKHTGTDTIKYLIGLFDGNSVECVRLQYRHGNTLCVSSQVGCKMGCGFCASTLHGMQRNLKWWEMLEQILLVNKDNKEPITHIVMMGSGEPLDNYREVLQFLNIVHNNLNISYRKMTISTCGIIPGINNLTKERIPITLSISLHGTNDNIRSKLMPINKVYPLEKLMASVKSFINETSRRVTFEYTLIDGINDSEENAKELIRLLQGTLCHVNLIPLNKVKEKPYRPSRSDKIQKFKDIIEKSGIPVTLRREMGQNLFAACGQLRNTRIEKEKE
jgi:23S rRNA (adenine2503-C2)-methyltransferase